MTKRSAVLAAAAAAIFLTGGTTTAAASDKDGGETIHCEGVNGCKGKSACATDHSACNGQNECAGKGWVEMTPDECEAAKAAQANK